MAGAAPSAKPAPFLRPFDVADRGILLAESALSLVVVSTMVLSAVAEAVAGVLGIQNALVSASSDVLLHGTIWAAFLGASFATRARRHLAIDVVGRLLPERARRVVAAVACTLGSVVAFSLARGIHLALLEQVVQTHDQLLHMQQSGIGGAAIDRTYEFQFIIPGGFLLIALRLLLHGFHEFAAAAVPPLPAQPRAQSDDGPYRTADDDAPAEASVPAETEVREAPVAFATATEIGIAIGVLVVLVALSAGSTVVGPLAGGATVAGLLLAVPLLLRWQRRKSFAPTVTMPPQPTAAASPKAIGAGIVGVAAVIALAWLGIHDIQSIPVGWGIAFFAFMALLGAPLFTFLGGLALFLWLHGTEGVPAMSLPNAVEDVLGPHFARMSVLPTIPIFTLAGYLLSESKAPHRLVRVARAFLGFMPGGLAVVCVFASAFFTVFSGASGITIVAVGGLLLPALLRDKYPERFSLGLVTTGGALGITLPLCLPLIVYGIVAGLQEVPPGEDKLELQKFMFAGLLPGLFLMGLLAVFGMIVGAVAKVPRSKFDLREAGAALWDAKWELLLPIFPVAGLLSGIFSPVGAAAFTALYVFVIETFFYKDLSLTKDIPRIVPDSMVLVGAIFVKLCAATVLTFFFVQAQTAEALFESLTCGPPAAHYLAQHQDTLASCREAVDALARSGQTAGGIIDSQISFLIALNFFLLVVGMLMDIFSAIVVIVPLIMGIAIHFHIDPYHLGVIFLLNLEIGYLMPPMGLNLFIAGFRFNRPVPDLYRVVLPFIGLFIIALLVTTYVPWLTLRMVPGHHGQPPPAQQVQVQTVQVPEVVDAGVPALAADCNEQRDGESFEQFDLRCNITGTHSPAPAPAATGGGSDCDQPRDGESFEDFDHRCSITGGGGGGDTDAGPGGEATPAPPPSTVNDPDCDEPRAGESFDAFNQRCHVTP